MTESRPPYQVGSFGEDGYDESGYDKNGLDRWGVSRDEKERIFAKLAKRFEEQPNSMASLMVEYRKQEGITQETLLARLEITPAQYSHLALCFIPKSDERFESDLTKIVEASGANLLELASICRQVFALRAYTKRPPVNVAATQDDPAGSPARVNALRMTAARDRADYAKSLREERAQYEPRENVDAASAAPVPAVEPTQSAPAEDDEEAAGSAAQDPLRRTDADSPEE